jgi:threonine dehydrogenase-like Zn-dependent dehydrogenase
MTTATRALQRALMPGSPAYGEGFGPSKSVVIQGAGAIGTLAAAAAKISGAGQIIMVGAPENRLKIAKKFGVDETINIEDTTKAEERIQKVKSLTSVSHGPDVVVEATGVPAAFREGLEMVRPGGSYVEVGHFVDAGEISINPFLICTRDINLYGSMGYSEYDYETAINILYKNRDQFPFEELITHEFALEDAEKAVLAAEQGKALKAAIVP